MKKIIIFTSDGAGGHTATKNAIIASLGPDYTVQSVNIFTQVIGNVDVIKTLSFGRFTGETFYEHCLIKKHFTFLNILHKLGKWHFKRIQKKLSRMFQQFIQDNPADLVISVVPLMNGAILDATKKLDIPFIVVPTDLDVTNYVYDLIKPAEHKSFRFALAYASPTIERLLAPANISSDQIHVAGFPIRPDFFEQKDLKAIRKAYQVPDEKPVVFLFMGSVGSDALYTFAHELSKLSQPAHIIICTGRYESIKEKINTIEFPAHISVTIVGFIQRISDVMAIADLMVGKSGSVSVNESFYMNVPLLIDSTSGVLDWERFNSGFIKNNKFGDVITKIEDIVPMVDNLLQNRDQLELMKNNLKSFEKKHGGNEIKQLVER